MSLAGRPSVASAPLASSVSVAYGGLTTLTLMPRGASRAAARTKPSSALFTRLHGRAARLGEAGERSRPSA